ncbi:MAG: hypothetical protein ACI8V5_003720 [Limisphaerales bacterium]|jgi:hypothetical protein
MMHIKLECYCGMKYEFDVEPVDGRMPYAINCPNCDGDGTDYANQFIAQNLRPQPALATPPLEPQPDLPPAGKPDVAMFVEPLDDEPETVDPAPAGFEAAAQAEENLAAANAEARRERMAAIKQKQENEQQQWKKIGRLGALGVVLVLGLVVAWGWYAFYGSKPRLYRVVEAQEQTYNSSARLLEPDRLLLLDDSGLALHDLKSGEILWQTEVDAGDEGIGYSRLEIIGEHGWVFRDNAVSRVNLTSGQKDASVKVSGAISQVTSSDKSILISAASSRRGYQSLTRIDLATAKTKAEEVKVEESISVSAGRVGGEENFEPSVANLTARELRVGGLMLVKNWDDFVPTGENLAQVSVLLKQPKVTSVRAMRPIGESALNQNATAAMDPTALVDEMVNEITRAFGGGTKDVNESTYEVTLRRRFADKAAVWKGTLKGDIRFFAGKGVDVLTDMEHLYIFDKQNQLLKKDPLSFPVHSSFSTGSENVPFLEHGGRLYFFDQGALTAYELPSGKAAWRLPSVGITTIQANDDNHLFVNSTTAPVESIQYSEQEYIKDRPKSVLIKVNAKSGKKLWESKQAGQKSRLAGDYLYGTQVSSSSLRSLTGASPADRFKLLRIDPGDGDRIWEKMIEGGQAIDFNGTRILVQFGGNYRVFKYLTLF